MNAQLTSPKSKQKSARNTVDVARDLLILHVDVDQGESTLLIEREKIGDGEWTKKWCGIIDGGFATAGRGSLIRYLRNFNVRKVDLMVCTHFDGDHTKGLVELLENHVVPPGKQDDERVQVTKLLVRNTNPKSHKSSTKLRLLGVAGKRKVPVEQARLTTYGTAGNTKVDSLRDGSGEYSDENEGSLAFRVRFGEFSYYTAGDLPQDLEIALEVGPVDAMKCGHHGSANSTPPELIDELQPRAAFISCGRNSYGHPTFDVIERLCDAKRSLPQWIYLTNCIHNRQGVNSKFETTEKEVVFPAYVELAELEKPLELAEKGIYDTETIQRELDALPESSTIEDDEERRQRNQRHRVLKAMLRAAEHVGAAVEDIGYVAGDATHLGTVVLRVPSPAGKTFEVGLYDEADGYFWMTHNKDGTVQGEASADQAAIEEQLSVINTKVRKSVKKAAKITRLKAETKAKGKGPQTPVTPSKSSAEPELKTPEKKTPTVMDVITSPKKLYQEHITARAEQYARFRLPTVIGLRAKSGGEPYIPFCTVCRMDFDEDNPDFELVEVTSEEGEVDMHRICFFKVFVSNLKLKNEDGELLTKDDAYDLKGITVEVPILGLNDWGTIVRQQFQAGAARVPKNKVYGTPAWLKAALKSMKLRPRKDE